MDTADALAQLTELSTDVVEVVAVAQDGSIEAHVGATLARAAELAGAGAELIAQAAQEAPSVGEIARVQVERDGGGLFVVAEHGRLAVATTVAEATSGLVVHDLRTVLRRSAHEGDDK
jgi:hypothetical protein